MTIPRSKRYLGGTSGDNNDSDGKGDEGKKRGKLNSSLMTWMSMTVYAPVPEAGSMIDGLHSKHALLAQDARQGKLMNKGERAAA